MAGMFMLSTLSFAGSGKFNKEHKNIDPEQKAKWEAVKKEKTEYLKNIQTLVDKYNKASDKDKPAIKQELTKLVSNQTDKNLAMKRDKISEKRNEISKMETKISDIEKDRASFVAKKVDFMLSAEGQEKMQKMKEGKKDKKEFNKDKKDFKKHKGDKKSK